MKTTPTLLAAALALLIPTGGLAHCTEHQAELTKEARQAAGALMQQLSGTLKATIAQHGPEAAIPVCKEKATPIAAEVSRKTGMQLARVSTRNRNPAGVPDEWEAQAIAELEARLAKGEKPETLEVAQVVDTPNGPVFRYAKALVVQPLCLTCHGSPEYIPEAVKARLATEYPQDKATGYAPGMLRGVVSVRKPL